MWIVLWDPILKFFFNKVLVGPMNSARDLLEKKKKLFSSCTGPIVHILKKKKAKMQTLAFISCIQMATTLNGERES